jgi:hypothetical protein
MPIESKTSQDSYVTGIGHILHQDTTANPFSNGLLGTIIDGFAAKADTGFSVADRALSRGAAPRAARRSQSS